MKFAIAKTATPILETPDFKAVFGGGDGNSLPLDDQRLLRQVSAVAFPQTKFELLEQCGEYVYSAKCLEHRLQKLFVDIRFLEEVDAKFPEREKILPAPETISERLHALLGTPYVWGGNWHSGIPEMKTYYPSKASFETLDIAIQNTWLIKGVDCSGLLYEVTDGIAPRATSLMVNYGHAIPIAGRDSETIRKTLQPLDLIIWEGHVIIVADSEYIIESRGGNGVIRTSLRESLAEIMREKSPVDDWQSTANIKQRFIVRRWL